jgi:AcrR family transcriptional regulator
VRELGFNKVSMRHIAERSGLVRQTVYNYYSSKHDLLGEAFLREGTELAQSIADHIRGINSIEDQFVEAFLYLLEALPCNPILALMVEPGNEFLSTIRMELPFEQFGMLAFGDVFRDNPELATHAEEISEYWSRNALSFLTFRTTERNRTQLAIYVRRRLVPGLRLQEILS